MGNLSRLLNGWLCVDILKLFRLAKFPLIRSSFPRLSCQLFVPFLQLLGALLNFNDGRNLIQLLLIFTLILFLSFIELHFGLYNLIFFDGQTFLFDVSVSVNDSHRIIFFEGRQLLLLFKPEVAQKVILGLRSSRNVFAENTSFVWSLFAVVNNLLFLWFLEKFWENFALKGLYGEFMASSVTRCAKNF